MAGKKKTTKKREPITEQQREDVAEIAASVSFLRLLPCPGAHSIHIFSSLQLKPPRLEQVFLAAAIGPNLTDVHAMAAVGVKRDASLRGIEVLQGFAISNAAFMAICEGIRAVLAPLGFIRFEGHINMLSTTTPIRVLESRPFYEPIIPNLPTM